MRLDTLPQLSSVTQLCSLLKLDRPGQLDAPTLIDTMLVALLAAVLIPATQLDSLPKIGSADCCVVTATPFAAGHIEPLPQLGSTPQLDRPGLAATQFAAVRLDTLPQLGSPTQLCSLLKLDRPGHPDTLQLGATPLAKHPRQLDSLLCSLALCSTRRWC